MAAQNIDKTAAITITRPNNTTSYAAGQVINENASTSMIEVKLNCQQNQNCWLVGGQAIDSVSQSSLAFDILFFSSSLTIPADGAAFDLSDSNLASYYLGRLSFTTFKAYASNSVSDAVTASGKPIVLTPNTQSVYAVLVATSAYTPTAQEQITFKLDYQQIY